MRTPPLLCFSALVLAACVSLGGPYVRDQALYNHSPSLPRGLYLRTHAAPTRGAFVTVRAVDVAPAYAALRDFAGPHDRFIKRVVAGSGDIVCADGDTITINARTVAHRAARDHAGRSLPRWTGCARLSDKEIFLMGDTADSFDGRYWGPITLAMIEGVWRPLRAPAA